MDKKILLVWMCLLTFLAGALNAISIVWFAATTVSHLTGLISRMSIGASELSWATFWAGFRVVLAFFLGAIVSGFITAERAFVLKKRYGCIIITIGVLLIIPYFLYDNVDKIYSILIFAFVMGMQNGMVVSIKGVVVRMTHMSGNVTDLGVFIGYRLRGNKNEKGITGIVPLLALLSFFVGGVLGIILFKSISNIVFLIMAFIYILLGILYFVARIHFVDKDFNGIPDELEKK